MRLPKFLLLIILITLFSLLYVYQQTEIFCLAYVCQKKQLTLEDLLDKNSILRYNIDKNSSLVRIGNKVSQITDFQMPDSYRLVKLTLTGETAGSRAQIYKRENIVLRLFGIKRQAEAKTINHSTSFPSLNSARFEGNLVESKQRTDRN